MRLHRYSLIGTALLGWCGAIYLSTSVIAAPTASPSVRHAVRLKYYPPPGWIRHYLGDDRYRIDGKIWRVVSTQMDTYYHRPNCPNMMRQPADIVIGFPSGQDAIEAGYNADHLCQPEEPVVVYMGPPGSMAPGGGAAPGVSSVPQNVSLPDGSSFTLPANWQRVTSVNTQNQGFQVSMNVFRPVRGRGVVSVSTMTFPTLPGGVDISRILTPEGLKGNNSVFNTSGIVNTQMSNAEQIINKVNVTSANLGGMRGVRIAPKRGAVIPGMRGTAILVGRGQKMYVIEDATNGSRDANTIIRSFRPR